MIETMIMVTATTITTITATEHKIVNDHTK